MNLSKGVKVDPENAERTKKLLKDQKVLSKKKKVKKDGGVIFPIKNKEFDLQGIEYERVEDEFEEFKLINGYESLLESIDCSITSYDVIGDIAILEIPEGFEKYEKKIGETLLKERDNIRSVHKKSSAVEGDRRVRRYEWLAGEKRTETRQKEYGCEFKVDFSKVFFSPRLSYERNRVRNLVTPGEMIIDMFAGVGPYSVLIAKRNPVHVLGYDINEAAVRYFRENIRINKVSHRVEAALGDCRIHAPRGEADRVIMNLPKRAKDFFEDAVEMLKPEGGFIHYYGQTSRASPYDEQIRYIKSRLNEMGRRCEVTEKRVVRSYSPKEVHIVLDLEISP